MGGGDTYLGGDLGLICYTVLFPFAAHLTTQKMWKCIQRFQTSAKPKSTFKKANGKKEEEAERDVTSRSPLGLTGSSGTGATGTELVNTCDKVNLSLGILILQQIYKKKTNVHFLYHVT